MRRAALPLLLLAVDSAAGVGKLGKSTYAMSHPFAWKDFMEKYFPTQENLVTANSTDQCVEWVKLCIDDGQLTACHGPQGSNCQMHSVGAYLRDSGSKSMQELEKAFSAAVGDMTKYDPFMDFHMGFYTADLDSYVSAFKADGVPTFVSSFVDPETSKTYHSCLVQSPGSLAAGAGATQNIELIGDSAGVAAAAAVHLHTVPRASPSQLRAAEAAHAAAPRKTAADGKAVLQWMHKSFASGNLTEDVTFFEKALLGKKTASYSKDGVSFYSGKMTDSDTTEWQYVQRTQKTQGPTSVAEWNAYARDLHTKCIIGELQGFDRLADNHLGHALGVDLTPYIAAVKEAGYPFRFYGQAQMPFFYVYMPNGQGVQLIGQCDYCPAGGGYDFCTGGITGNCQVG